MSAPLIWIFLPSAASLILMFFRKKYPLICLIQSGLCLLLAVLPNLTQFDPVLRTRWYQIYLSPGFELLGRSLTLDGGYRVILVLLYGLLAIWSLIVYLTKVKTLLVPLGLLFNALMLMALSVEPFLYAALIVQTAVIISIPILTERGQTGQKGVARFLIFITMGMPFILLAGWFLAGGEISPINEDQLLQATLLLGLGFIFWLAVFPFHSWLPLVSEEIKPIKTFYVLITLPIVVFILLMKFLDGFVWLRDYQLIYDAIRVFGLIMVMSGNIWAIFQSSLRKILGYLLLSSLGTILLSISVNSNEGFLNATHLIVPRMVVFLLAAVSIDVLEKIGSPIQIFQLKSAFFQFPLSAVGIMVAFFSLTGMPLTIGFAPMLTLYQLLTPRHGAISFLLLASMAALTIFFLRITYHIFLPLEFKIADEETRREKILLAGLLLPIMVIGLYPAPVFRFFSEIVRGFDLLIR